MRFLSSKKTYHLVPHLEERFLLNGEGVYPEGTIKKIRRFDAINEGRKLVAALAYRMYVTLPLNPNPFNNGNLISDTFISYIGITVGEKLGEFFATKSVKEENRGENTGEYVNAALDRINKERELGSWAGLAVSTFAILAKEHIKGFINQTLGV